MNSAARGERGFSPAFRSDDASRYAAWFQELDAWTEYWDIYHPETHGRYYFGDGGSEPGLLTVLLPQHQRPAVFTAWTRAALALDFDGVFGRELSVPHVAAAVLQIDALVASVFARYFGNPRDPWTHADYLEATHRFAIDALPPADERAALIRSDDPRKATAGRHTLDGDLMWFGWALQLEAAHRIAGLDTEHPRRALQMAAVATGCAANFTWRGHRRTRAEYASDSRTTMLLRERGMRWAGDFDAATAEVHALYRIREWGHD